MTLEGDAYEEQKKLLIKRYYFESHPPLNLRDSFNQGVTN